MAYPFGPRCIASGRTAQKTSPATIHVLLYDMSRGGLVFADAGAFYLLLRSNGCLFWLCHKIKGWIGQMRPRY
jgi:hypothetical protein